MTKSVKARKIIFIGDLGVCHSCNAMIDRRETFSRTKIFHCLHCKEEITLKDFGFVCNDGYWIKEKWPTKTGWSKKKPVE